jgi:hypothetical protein
VPLRFLPSSYLCFESSKSGSSKRNKVIKLADITDIQKVGTPPQPLHSHYPRRSEAAELEGFTGNIYSSGLGPPVLSDCGWSSSYLLRTPAPALTEQPPCPEPP